MTIIQTTLAAETSSMEPFLANSQDIDWKSPQIMQQAKRLKNNSGDLETARQCFEFVRDEIEHSCNTMKNPVTSIASDVLRHRVGYCYSKSHLLGALLRANGIPTGFCYQRLSLKPPHTTFCLHGLNAIYLRVHGWYRVDARGNNTTISTNFSPPTENLAYRIQHVGEHDFTQIWPEPLPVVTQALEAFQTVEELNQNLPDLDPMTELPIWLRIC
jgi:transglutaminase-like putative cysteine protease